MNALSRDRLVAAALLLALVVWSWAPAAGGRAPGGGAASPAPTAGVDEPPSTPLLGEWQAQVWLRGPFGRVPGGPVDDPATAAPLGRPLDTFVRRAPLSMDWEIDGLVVGLAVVAQPLLDASSQQMLSAGTPTFEGPDTAGRHLLTASLTSATGETSRYAWLLEVPDREPPAGGLYDIRAPDVIVESGSGSMVGLAGDGCYLYLCVDVGRMPPPRTLRTLAVDVGEVLTMRLGDESAITAWEGSLTALRGADGKARTASGGPPAAGTAALGLTGLEVPATGEWLLDLEIELDRERGWLRTAYRLVAD